MLHVSAKFSTFRIDFNENCVLKLSGILRNMINISDCFKIFRILGIERKPRKTTSSKWHATQNTRRGHRKGKQTALKQRGGLRSRTNSNDAFKSCNACFLRIQEFSRESSTIRKNSTFSKLSAKFGFKFRQNFLKT